MEQLGHFNFQDEPGPFDEAGPLDEPSEPVPSDEIPEEAKAEIEEGLQDLYITPGEADELGPKIKLNRRQVETGFLYYLTNYCGKSGWYRGRSDEPKKGAKKYPSENPKKNDKSVVIELCAETGFHERLFTKILQDYEARGLVQTEIHPLKPDTITGVKATRPGREAFKRQVAANPEDIETIDAFLVRHRRTTILLVRHEVNHEQQLLGYEPDVFEELSSFSGYMELNKHLIKLRQTQAKLLQEIKSKAVNSIEVEE